MSDEIVIQCEQLSKTYRRGLLSGGQAVRALDSVALNIRAGAIVGLIGPNGAGKSTLMGLVAGLLQPTDGEVTVCGHEAGSIGARRELGFMPERPAFLGTYSARAVLRYHAAMLGMSRRLARQRTEELLTDLELSGAADRPCAGFSQGMRQRLALGISLLTSPKVLLLDEPSNGLDPVGIVKLREMLTRLGEAGTTIMVSSHRLGELERLTSEYVFLQHGKVVAFDAQSPADGPGRLRVEVLGGGAELAGRLTGRTVVESADAYIILEIAGRQDVPDVVAELVGFGARITAVGTEGRDIEQAFMHLYKEKQ